MNKNERRKNNINNKCQKELINIIEDLYNNYSGYNEIYIKNLLNLISLFENVSLAFESLSSKLNFPQTESLSLFNNDPSICIINAFYNYLKNIFNNILKVSKNIKQNIIPKLNEYKKNLENDNSNILFFMEDTIKKINEYLKKINEANKQYKIESEKLKKLELDSLKKLHNTSLLGAIHKTLDDQRKKVSNYSYIHQQDIQTLNKFYSESQEEMSKKIFQIKSLYKNNNYIIFECIKEFLNKWNDIVIDYHVNVSKKIIEKIEFDEENQNSDNFITKLLLNDNNKNIFFKKWKYIQINISENHNNNFINEDDDDEDNPHLQRIKNIPFTNIKYDPEYMFIIKDLDKNIQQNEISKNQLNNKKLEDSKLLINFFLSLRKNKDILNNQLSGIVNLLEQKTGEIDFYQEFCDIYISSNNKKMYSLFEFTNFTNLAHLKSFLNNILENISLNLNNKNIESFSLLDKIIIIGEKSLYDNTYLCSLLNKNKIFNKKNIWEDCIKFKVIDLLNEICNQETIGKNVINEGINKLYNKGTKLIGGIGGLFGFESKKVTKNENLIEYLGLIKYLPKYNDLSEDKKIILTKNQAPFIINEVFKIYMRHMANYNYSLDDSINVIYDIYNYFQFNNNNIINYYLNFNNICYYSCKNKVQKFDLKYKKEKNDEKIKEKIKDIRNRRNYTDKYQNKLTNEKGKIIIIKKVFIFLEDKEKIKLISLSKNIKNTTSEKIYKYILKQKNTSIRAHVEIWKIFLNFFKLKNKNTELYNNLKKELEKPETREKNLKNFKVIEVDVKRTEFLKEKQKGKKAIDNILKCLQIYNLENNYCQGMNYMAAFLYESILDEEDSFYIILCLITNKNFSSLYKNGMSELKNYFIIMERLIYLFLPKIYCHFKNNQVMPDFFLSPFFITLFAHIYPALQEKNNIFIIRIWDEFIINGWKSICEAILTILKIKEKNILNYQGDELVDFLVNKINKEQIFLNKNYEQFEQMKKYFIIPEELMTDLKEEIILENKINQ